MVRVVRLHPRGLLLYTWLCSTAVYQDKAEGSKAASFAPSLSKDGNSTQGWTRAQLTERDHRELWKLGYAVA